MTSDWKVLLYSMTSHFRSKFGTFPDFAYKYARPTSPAVISDIARQEADVPVLVLYFIAKDSQESHSFKQI